MARYALVIDMDRCSGCQACAVACMVENNIPTVGQDQAEKGRRLGWIRMVEEERQVHGEAHAHEAPQGGDRARVFPMMCGECDDAPCIKVCPVYATYRSAETGIVGQVYSRCIGCRFCMAACPYTAKTFNWFEYTLPEPERARTNPDVSVRPKGVVEKCTFCHHRLLVARDRARLEDRDVAPGEYVPACVESCPAGAMVFGDLDDATDAVAALGRSPRAHRLLESLGTKPKLFYLLSQGE